MIAEFNIDDLAGDYNYSYSINFEFQSVLSENKKYLCIFNSSNGVAMLFRSSDVGFIFIRKLYGRGIFITNEHLLLFYNNSGYGYLNTDSYLYNILDDSFVSYFLTDYSEIVNPSRNYAPDNSFFITRDGLIQSEKYLILMDDLGDVYFYDKKEMIYNYSMNYFFSIKRTIVDIGTLCYYDEKKEILAYSNQNIGHLEYLKVNFQENTPKERIDSTLQIESKYYFGFALDYNIYNKQFDKNDGIIHTIRTDIGEKMYQLKYCNTYSVVNDLAKILYDFILSQNVEFDIIIPVPPTNVNRQIQPVYALSLALSKLTGVKIDGNYIENKNTFEIKKIDKSKQREFILENAFQIEDKKYSGKNVLLLDDYYRSGATLYSISKKLVENGQVAKIFALCVVKI